MKKKSFNVLSPSERTFLLYKLNQACLEEINRSGFISDSRLVDSRSVACHESVKMIHHDKIIRFVSLPADCKTIYLYFNEDRVEAYVDYLSNLHPKIKRSPDVTIESPKIGVEYDLKVLGHITDFRSLDETTLLYLGNTIYNPFHYVHISGSFITVVVLRNGFILINLVNLICNSLTFRASSIYDNAYDIIVDSDKKAIGDIEIVNVGNGMKIYNPSLSNSLKKQALLYPLGVGKFTASVDFCYAPEFSSGHFVDMTLYEGKKSIDCNKRMLAGD